MGLSEGWNLVLAGAAVVATHWMEKFVILSYQHWTTDNRPRLAHKKLQARNERFKSSQKTWHCMTKEISLELRYILASSQ
jgi:hypothetical protein